nr:putative ORF1 [Marmot picobirnavirus]
MTTIQIDYLRNKETGRHNVAMESQAKNELTETKRHNKTVETESGRHNRATESQAKNELKETTRHNKTTEKETTRHNKRTEKQTDKVIKETKRHNVKTEKQTDKRISEEKRHNRRSEGIDAQKAQAARTQAAAATRNAQTQAIKAEAEVALNRTKADAQQWINDWKEENPVAATMQQMGVKATGKVADVAMLGAMGLDLATAINKGFVDSAGNWTYSGSKKAQDFAQMQSMDSVRAAASAYASQQKGWTTQQQEAYVNKTVREAKKKGR